MPEWFVVILVHITSLTWCKVLSQHTMYSMGIYGYLFITRHPNEIEILVILNVRKTHNVCNRPSNEHSWKCESNWYSGFREDNIFYCKTNTTTTIDDTDLTQMLIKQQPSWRKLMGYKWPQQSRWTFDQNKFKNIGNKKYVSFGSCFKDSSFLQLQVTLSLRRRTKI